MTAPTGPTPTPLVVEIGLKEIYDLLVALNTHVTVLAGDLKDLSKQGDDHETRLRALEAAPKAAAIDARVTALEREREAERKAALDAMRTLRRQVIAGVLTALVPAVLAAVVVLIRVAAH